MVSALRCLRVLLCAIAASSFESLLMLNLDKRIGELATIYPLTYYFGVACNLIGVLLEEEIGGGNEPGDLLIVNKGLSSGDRDKLIYDIAKKKLFITDKPCIDSDVVRVIGEIVEERYNGRCC